MKWSEIINDKYSIKRLTDGIELVEHSNRKGPNHILVLEIKIKSYLQISVGFQNADFNKPFGIVKLKAVDICLYSVYFDNRWGFVCYAVYQLQALDCGVVIYKEKNYC